MPLDQTMPIDQAIGMVDTALSQMNSNRETHALFQTAIARIRNEVSCLNEEVGTRREKIEELQREIVDLNLQLKNAREPQHDRAMEAG